jgi:hypothetical protein
MNRLSQLIVFCSTFSICQAQFVGDKPLSEINVDYIQIEEVSRMLSSKSFIEVDYGQNIKLLDRNERIKDEKGNDIEFNSMVDALNFLSKYGYEFLTIIPISDPAVPRVRYILKKKILK